MTKTEPMEWLKRDCMPIWLARGFDRNVGGFVENLSFQGEPTTGSRRCMVQARQIFSFRTALTLGAIDRKEATIAVTDGARALTRLFSLPSGAFRHAVNEAGAPLDETPGLYGQAFALFGLAEAYALLGDRSLVDRAQALVEYLHLERRAKGGGYTELEAGRVVFRSNPHMHLFEAALAWAEANSAPIWRELCDEILELCLTRFVDSSTGLLGENFLEGWRGETSADGRFVWEPGHHCEWSWLLGRYQLIFGRDLTETRRRLVDSAETYGRDPCRNGALIDQMWSDLTPKLKSARFWPQCERIKACAQLGRVEAAREGMGALFRYFDVPVRGLWHDTWGEDGSFRATLVKASSLYHIIGAIAEFEKLLRSADLTGKRP